MNFANMEEHRRLFWLLLLALFQPSYSHSGAACNITSKRYPYGYLYRDYYNVQCALTSLEMNVPLTTYIDKYTDPYGNKSTNVRAIDFSSSTINTVPVGVFQVFSAVKLLKMDNVSISNTEPGALRGLKQLEELTLSHNNISEIQDGTFDGLLQLKKLNMAGNKLTTLKLLKGLASLQWLDVERNNIATIDDGTFKHTANLENLNLNRNKLVNLNADTFGKLLHLETLTLNNNRITSIPVGTFRYLGKLTTLEISFNNLTYLEFGFFGGLTRLEKLDLSDNNIAVLESKVLYPLRSLFRLYLDGNLLSTFDVGTMISYLTTLKYISLDRNQIQCELLTSYIYLFRLRDIKVHIGYSFKTKNVHGIYCESDIAQRSSVIPTDVGVKVTQPLLLTTKQPITRKSVASTTEDVATTTVFSFTEAPASVDVSTEHLAHTQPMDDRNDHTAGDYNTAEPYQADEKLRF